MIAGYYNSFYSLSYLNTICYKDKDGISLLSLSEGAKKIGLDPLAVKVDLETIKNGQHLPVIIFWKQKHFIIVYKIKKNKVYTADPAVGYVNYNLDEFMQGFSIEDNNNNGIALLLKPTKKFDSPNENKEKIKKSEFIKNHLKENRRNLPLFLILTFLLFK